MAKIAKIATRAGPVIAVPLQWTPGGYAEIRQAEAALLARAYSNNDFYNLPSLINKFREGAEARYTIAN